MQIWPNGCLKIAALQACRMLHCEPMSDGPTFMDARGRSLDMLCTPCTYGLGPGARLWLNAVHMRTLEPPWVTAEWPSPPEGHAQQPRKWNITEFMLAAEQADVPQAGEPADAPPSKTWAIPAGPAHAKRAEQAPIAALLKADFRPRAKSADSTPGRVPPKAACKSSGRTAGKAPSKARAKSAGKVAGAAPWKARAISPGKAVAASPAKADATLAARSAAAPPLRAVAKSMGDLAAASAAPQNPPKSASQPVATSSSDASAKTAPASSSATPNPDEQLASTLVLEDDGNSCNPPG